MSSRLDKQSPDRVNKRSGLHRTDDEKQVRRKTLAVESTVVGQVFVVGSGDCGQLGLGTDVLERESPALLRFFDQLDIVGVYAGGMHNVALSLHGSVYSWGCNDHHALGRAGEETQPLQIVALKNHVVVRVACGDSVSCFLTAQGCVYACGTFRNAAGILGFR